MKSLSKTPFLTLGLAFVLVSSFRVRFVVTAFASLMSRIRRKLYCLFVHISGQKWLGSLKQEVWADTSLPLLKLACIQVSVILDISLHFRGKKGLFIIGPLCNLLFIPQAFEGLLRTCLWRQCCQSCSALQNLRLGNQRSTGSDLIFQKFSSEIDKKFNFKIPSNQPVLDLLIE